MSLLCEQLAVSVSGYHQHALRDAANDGRKPGCNRLSDDALLAHIKAIHVQVKGDDGWPRMWKELLARGIRVGVEPNTAARTSRIPCGPTACAVR